MNNTVIKVIYFTTLGWFLFPLYIKAINQIKTNPFYINKD